jgi:16S rRNA processing protein RimM
LSDHVLKGGSSSRQILHVGHIGRAHGLSGEIRVTVLSSDPDRLESLGECLLMSADEKSSRPVIIESSRRTQGHSLVKLKGVDDRTQAERLTGCFLSVEREKAMSLRPGEWFICDIIGCRVRDEKLGDIGSVREILQNHTQDIYVVHQDGKPDLLFPAMKSILLSVDIENQQLDVRLPDGLFEVYRPKEG